VVGGDRGAPMIPDNMGAHSFAAEPLTEAQLAARMTGTKIRHAARRCIVML